jgi:hypothetical protein
MLVALGRSSILVFMARNSSGSMIQAVAEDEERGALGMPYTSVPKDSSDNDNYRSQNRKSAACPARKLSFGAASLGLLV